MNVLGMLPSYPPDHGVGSWVMTHTLLAALAERGHRVDVALSVQTGEPYVLDGVHVWPYLGKQDPFRFTAAASVIVTHAGSAARAATIGELQGIPVVQIAHSSSAVSEHAVKRRPVACTVFNSVQMRAAAGTYPGRSLVIRPPVHAGDYATTPGDRVTLVNLSEDKGADVFYQLAERMRDRKFLGVEGGYGVQVVPRSRDDLPHVELVGHVRTDQMREQVYARTRVLLMPSAHESWGRVAIEAACSGIPTIAHPTAGLRESLGGAGIFVDRDDIDAWERTLRRLLDGRSWRPASRKARARAAELDPAADLETWCGEIVELGRRRIRGGARLAG